MISLFLWLLLAIVTVIAFGLTFPEDTLEMCRKLRHWLKVNYAQHRGQAAAESLFAPTLWDIQPWERHWQPSPLPASTPPPRLWGLYRSHRLDTLNFLKLASLVWLIRLGLIEVEHIQEGA